MTSNLFTFCLVIMIFEKLKNILRLKKSKIFKQKIGIVFLQGIDQQKN